VRVGLLSFGASSISGGLSSLGGSGGLLCGLGFGQCGLLGFRGSSSLLCQVHGQIGDSALLGGAFLRMHHALLNAGNFGFSDSFRGSGPGLGGSNLKGQTLEGGLDSVLINGLAGIVGGHLGRGVAKCVSQLHSFLGRGLCVGELSGLSGFGLDQCSVGTRLGGDESRADSGVYLRSPRGHGRAAKQG